MRALTITAHDGFTGLRLTERPAPEPASGQVTIDVGHAGVGLIDAFWVSGVMPQQLGFVPGLEVSGRVRAVGAGVLGMAPGQVVAAITLGGGFADVAAARAEHVAALPDGLDPVTAAAVPIDTVTAHAALTGVGRLAPGERVLVHAGVGGLGSQFGQVARLLGASSVDAVVGSGKADRARALGYTRVFDRGDLGAVPLDSYDVVVDPVGGPATTVGFAALRGGGRLLRVGNASQAPDVPLGGLVHWLQDKTTAGFIVGRWVNDHPQRAQESLRWALDAVARGDLRVEVSDERDWADAASALAALQRGDTTGKIVLRIR